ncbi:hypothetical protein G3480_17315 [Thiorhodococcus mannitoliphagus]|uniref:Uncharacterized protein n=1 Tax=Thiorhodococcus mannitoliphagus TaxID=329406 RepID=A0A6P1E215_9GAMM|nr:hypothetical protein [Thiorhodococcus mannitoliphagus]NEX22044.1 hypothetical protein [Thiorhodococcus mannitoliphagus]
MKGSVSHTSSTAAAAAFVLLLGSASLSANAPSDLADLVGARGAGAETALGNRGYTYVSRTRGVQYWWNAQRQACVGIKVADGRYQSVSAARRSQCQQSAHGESGRPPPASSAAETACMTAVNSNYGGRVKDIKVVRSEFSQANSEVILDAVGVRGGSRTERWRCLSSSKGQVADLSVVQ